jgi:hypothetical protein
VDTAPSDTGIWHNDTWREALVVEDHPHPSAGHGNAYGWALPVNNGTKGASRCMVIDFESNLFFGTAMMRVKNVLPHPRSSDNATDVDNVWTGSYFRDKKRTFQGIVWGRFKCPGVPMSECVTGQAFHHPPSDQQGQRHCQRGLWGAVGSREPEDEPGGEPGEKAEAGGKSKKERKG